MFYAVSYTHLDVYKRQNHSSVVTDCETWVSVLQPSALKMAVEGTAEMFAHNNLGLQAYSPASPSPNNVMLYYLKAYHS